MSPEARSPDDTIDTQLCIRVIAGKSDELILTQNQIIIAYCLRAPKVSPSFQSVNATELNELENKIMLERIR